MLKASELLTTVNGTECHSRIVAEYPNIIDSYLQHHSATLRG